MELKPMVNPILSIDENANPIPAVALRRGAGAHSISSGAASARNSTAFDGDNQHSHVWIGSKTVH